MGRGGVCVSNIDLLIRLLWGELGLPVTGDYLVSLRDSALIPYVDWSCRGEICWRG